MSSAEVVVEPKVAVDHAGEQNPVALTTAIAPAASQVFLEQSVPRTMLAAPAQASVSYVRLPRTGPEKPTRTGGWRTIQTRRRATSGGYRSARGRPQRRPASRSPREPPTSATRLGPVGAAKPRVRPCARFLRLAQPLDPRAIGDRGGPQTHPMIGGCGGMPLRGRE